jgi:hypothetical protein
MLFWLALVCGVLLLGGAIYIWYLFESFVLG